MDTIDTMDTMDTMDAIDTIDVNLNSLNFSTCLGYWIFRYWDIINFLPVNLPKRRLVGYSLPLVERFYQV